jgi:undecaprenyl diphosphate synthase
MPSADQSVLEQSDIRHVLIVAGGLDEWFALDRDRWDARVSALGRVAASHGIAWVTLRPYHSDGEPVGDGPPVRSVTVDSATVLVDPVADGWERFAASMRRLEGEPINEATVAAVLYEPADTEPDLVVVLGPSVRLPPSVVWELAYAELVFLDAGWFDLDGSHLETAITEFSRRRRRFGGLDA